VTEHVPHMIINRPRVLWGSVVSLLLALVLTLLVANPSTREPIQDLDEWVRDRVTEGRVRGSVGTIEAVTALGSAMISWAVRGIVLLVLAVRRRYLQLGAFATAIVTSELCIGPLKALIERPRPPGGVVGTTGASFPSGHAVAISVTAIGLVIALMPPGRRRLRWEVLAVAVTSLTSLSRVYLGAHWLSDIVGGSLIGSGLALFWPVLFEEIRFRRLHIDHEAVEDATVDVDVGVSDEDRATSRRHAT
jgi:membrane-associated phospholipid phosphatase